MHQLRSRPTEFEGSLVRVSGIWYRDDETSRLFLKDAMETDAINVETRDQLCDSDRKYKSYKREVQRKIAQNQNGSIYAKVEFEGYFDVAPPPKRVIQGDTATEYSSGFGHFNSCPYQIRLTRIISYEFLR